MTSCLDFKVCEIPLPTLFERGVGIDLSEYKALVRKDNGTTLAVVRKTYKVVQNSDIFEQIAKEMIKVSASFKFDDSVSHGGKFCYRKYTFNDLTVPSITESKSNLHFQVIAQNSFGFSAIKLYIGAIDFFCTNGIIIGSFSSNYWRHSKNLKVDNLGKRVRAGVDAFVRKGGDWLQWQKSTITYTQVDHLLTDLKLSDSLKRDLLIRFDQETDKHGKTLWALYSAMTFYASHNSSEFPTRNTKTDHKETTLIKRAETVRRWSESEQFKRLTA